MESIAPGHHLYLGPDGAWRSCDEHERFARLSGPAALLERMRDQAYQGGNDQELEPLAAVLRERGVLAMVPEVAERELRVCVSGDGPVALHVARLLEGVVTVLVDGDPDAADVLVACAGWLPDERWQRIDAVGRVWHRCHVEGTRLVLGPMTVPGRTASYRDLRGRRLAAAPLPDELAGLWSYLDAGATDAGATDAGATGVGAMGVGAAGAVSLPPVPWPNVGAVALAAGLLVNDVLTWRATGLPASGSYQLVVDPATGGLDRHPVLPLPVA
ncbi:hypothetical protein Aple_026770 [Acrocarpospora pleiomorpha]|uniref:Uncharacterized protein n=1 Tax=Acrocarpospora pleiomorpha TaxID=90975 RepID=A0A5M3XJD4_9ACTN|nr:hypothetical protein [Acrocarpospora pleiomorpha]GES19781.1 hypothetical protein Aple_026770 [Acrocarpospora pleiomorpha]